MSPEYLRKLVLRLDNELWKRWGAPAIERVALIESAFETIRRDYGISDYLTRQWDWSRRTFGEGRRTLGITAHIRKELAEIEAKPDDLSEWVDVAIIAMDGYWRHGGRPETFMEDLLAKQQKNFDRTWPIPVSEDEAVEHDRSGE